MYKNILLPISFKVDRDTAAPIRVAKALAAPEAKITLLHVVEHLPPYAASYMPHDYLKTTQEKRQGELDVLAAQLPNANGVVIEGHSGRSILDWAERNRPDLIVIASHQPGMQDAILGSTTLQIVKSAKCSIHVAR